MALSKELTKCDLAKLMYFPSMQWVTSVRLLFKPWLNLSIVIVRLYLKFLNFCTEQLFNLKFAAKDLERNAKRSEKSEREEKVKLKKVSWTTFCDIIHGAWKHRTFWLRTLLVLCEKVEHWQPFSLFSLPHDWCYFMNTCTCCVCHVIFYNINIWQKSRSRIWWW